MSDAEKLVPRVAQETYQELLEGALLEFEPQVQALNQALGLYANNNLDDCKAWISPQIDELNDRWPFHGHSLFVSGHWYDKQYTKNSFELKDCFGRPRRSEVYRTALNNGFKLAQFEDGKPFVGMDFGTVRSDSSDEPLIEFIVAHLADVSIDYASPPGDKGLELERRSAQAILTYTKRFRGLFDTDSPFYSLRHTNQIQTVENNLERANKSMTMQGFYLAISLRGVKNVYERTKLDSPYGFAKIRQPVGSDKPTIDGVIRGLSILERDALTESPIRRPSQLISPGGGLCVMLEPFSTLNPVEGKNIFAVPVSQFDRFGLEVYTLDVDKR